MVQYPLTDDAATLLCVNLGVMVLAHSIVLAAAQLPIGDGRYALRPSPVLN